jgi:transposase
LLSCLIASGDAARGRMCCRLACFHQPSPRTRRYPSDTTDAQWALIDVLLPDPAWLRGQGGRPETHCRRAIVDAIFYVVDNGIKWRALPADFPPWSTVYNYFAAWEAAGVTQDVLDDLRDRVRLADGRAACPSAAIIDSQTVKAAETVARSNRGFDAGKKINGTKRHIAVDTLGLLLCVLVTTAGVQDRGGARPLLSLLANCCFRVRTSRRCVSDLRAGYDTVRPYGDTTGDGMVQRAGSASFHGFDSDGGVVVFLAGLRSCPAGSKNRVSVEVGELLVQ